MGGPDEKRESLGCLLESVVAALLKRFEFLHDVRPFVVGCPMNPLFLEGTVDSGMVIVVQFGAQIGYVDMLCCC